MLLMGEPDSGKTTLLRGVARELAKQNRAVAVIDERREIFPSEESAALPLDILSGIPKGQAVQMALRTLSPQVILLDELGGMDELYALEQGLFSGVEFIATLHAASWEEAARRPQVQYLQKCGALHVAVLLKGRTAPGQLKEVRVS
jgi:stage III sporulation protein AA